LDRPCVGAQVAALPWREASGGGVEVLLITSRTNGRWMLPKGWPMPGRTDADAAGIEAFEEAGVRGRMSALPLGSYHFIKLLKDDVSTLPSQAVIFGLRVEEILKKWPEKTERQRKWMSPAEASEAVWEPDLARFLRGLAAGRVVL
jgi:8-oxo-dGTP pyrophosphatase MutT (NUDIX family)